MMCHDRCNDVRIKEQACSRKVDEPVKVHREIDGAVVDSFVNTQREYLAGPSPSFSQDRKPLGENRICRQPQLRIGNDADCARRPSGLNGEKSYRVWMQVMDSAPQLTILIHPQGVSFAEIDVTNELKCLLTERPGVCDNNVPVVLRSEPVFIVL